ncbi:MAG TPA: apolipoprotein N-acyltransferase [Actinomycetes bacterium]
MPRALAVLLGAPLALAFPRPSLWVLAFFGLAPLVVLVRSAPSGREAAVVAWLGGAGFFFAVDSFVLNKVGPFAPPLALLLGTTWLPWGWLAWALLRGRPGPGRVLAALLLVPSAWVAGEYVRSWQGFGGPWGLLGASQWNQPAVLALASVGGVWAVGFLLVAVNVGVAVACRPLAGQDDRQQRRPRASLFSGGFAVMVFGGRAGGGAPRSLALGVPLALVAGTLAYAAARPAPGDTRTIRVALVQPGVISSVEARFRASEAATLGLAGSRPDLVVWGESSVGRDPDRNPGDLVRIAAAARAVGAPVLVNVDADRAGGGGIYKSSVLVGPDGRRLGSYDKMRLVPFGEYVPLRPLFGWVTRFTDAAAADRRRGTSLRVLHAGPVAAGPLVCFESAFPDLARNLAARGADLVVVQSATTTFQHSWGPDQHASLAAVRAVESGRPVVQAALSGVSAAFDARGRRLAWRPTGWRGAVVVELPRSGGTTPYVRFGDWLPRACCLALAGAALAALSRRRRSRPKKEEALPSATEALQREHR